MKKKKKGKEKRRKNCSAQRFFIIGHPLCLIRLCQMPIRPSSNSTVKLPVPPSFIRAFNFALFRGVVSSYVHETVRKIWNSVCTPRIPCRFLLAPFSRPSIHVSALIPSRIVFRARFFFFLYFSLFFLFFFFRSQLLPFFRFDFEPSSAHRCLAIFFRGSSCLGIQIKPVGGLKGY